MGAIEIILVVVGLVSLLFASILTILAFKIYQGAATAVQQSGVPVAKEKRVLVPGKGMFQVQKKKLKPKYRTEEEVWTHFENERSLRR